MFILFKELINKAISIGEYRLLVQLAKQSTKLQKRSIALDNLLDKGVVYKKSNDKREVNYNINLDNIDLNNVTENSLVLVDELED